MSNNNLASYAVVEENSKGRYFTENGGSRYRSNFGRDRDRIIGSRAFRRLQYKTQVFVNNHGDHYRTRLTHSLEVAQNARWIAGGLDCNKDLAEIIALAHDIGHPPFGHAGEEALNFEMKKIGKIGFCHNAHALKLITEIERSFVEFRGLNLCWETLEGVTKHNGPIDISSKKTDHYIINYSQKHDLDLSRFSCLEAQIAAISDDITYNNHDIEDGLRAQVFTLEQLCELKIIREIYQEILQKYPKINRRLLISEAKKQLIKKMTHNAIENTRKNIEKYNIKTEEDIRNLDRTLVEFCPKMEANHQEIKKFLAKNMYHHRQVFVMTMRAKKIISELFNFYINDWKLLPEKYHAQINAGISDQDFSILVRDYIAGMTDRFAIQAHIDLCKNI